MNEAQSIEGWWWVSGENKSPEYGVVEFDPQTGLKLCVKIAPETPFTPYEGPGTDTLFGCDKHTKPITLFGCVSPGTDDSVALKTLTFHPSSAVVGWRSKSWPETKAKHINIRLTLLHNWMGGRCLNITGPPDSPQVCIRKRESIEVELTDRTILKIFWIVDSVQPSHTEFHEDHAVEFLYEEPKALEEILRGHTHSFRRMLTFLSGCPVFLQKVFLRTYDDETPQTAIFLQGNSGILTANRDLTDHNMLVAYRDVQDRVNDLIQRWYSIEGTLKDALNLYFATIFNRSLYSNQQFLFLAQALEVYHRSNSRFEGFVQAKTDFKLRRNRIINAVPDEEQWLKEKLQGANEKTLAQRLNDLLNAHSALVQRFIADPPAFAKMVKNTRNHFTHYATEEDEMEKIASGTELLKLTDQMQTLLEICIFSDLGISGDPVNRLLQNLRGRTYHSL